MTKRHQYLRGKLPLLHPLDRLNRIWLLVRKGPRGRVACQETMSEGVLPHRCGMQLCGSCKVFGEELRDGFISAPPTSVFRKICCPPTSLRIRALLQQIAYSGWVSRKSTCFCSSSPESSSRGLRLEPRIRLVMRLMFAPCCPSCSGSDFKCLVIIGD